MPITIHIEGQALFDQKLQKFLPKPKPRDIRLEHSLISVSKWEEQTKRQYFSKFKGPSTTEDLLFYIQCMSLDGPIDEKLLVCISQSELARVLNYINDNRTATTFRSLPEEKGSRNVLTSEVIYYYMAAFRLPWYAEKWHLSRLLALIRVANSKQSTGKKGKRDGVNYQKKVDEWSRINERNKALLHATK